MNFGSRLIVDIRLFGLLLSLSVIKTIRVQVNSSADKLMIDDVSLAWHITSAE